MYIMKLYKNRANDCRLEIIDESFIMNKLVCATYFHISTVS